MQQMVTQRGFRRSPSSLPPGNSFKRLITAKAIACITRESATEVIARMWPNDRDVEMLERATAAPATTFTTGWAAELATKVINDTMDAMGAASAAADVMRECLLLSWNGAGSIGVPGFVTSANNSSFVKEGDPIPVRQLSSASALLQPYKLATIAALTREMVEGSNAEALISDCLVRSTGLALDAIFFGSGAAVANQQPAGIRNGIATSTASANTDVFGAFFEDIATLLNAVGAVGGKGPFILVGSIGHMASATARFGSIKAEGQGAEIIPLVSPAVGNDIIAIAPTALTAAISPNPDVELAKASTLVMDTAPVTPDTTQVTKSMWQTDSLALKVRWPVTWALRDSRAVAWLTPIWK